MSQPTFRSMRADGTVKRGEANSVRLEDIHEEPGFNDLARDYDANDVQAVEELAAFIMAGGVVPPLEVRPRAEGGVWLVDGHLRTRALRLLDVRGSLPRTPKENEAWVSVVPFIGNDADRVLRLATSNTNTPVSALGLGRIYSKLLALKWTVPQIAERSGKTVGQIQRALDLAGGNTDVHEMVKAGEVSPTIAAKAVRAHGDAAGPVLAEQLEQAKAVGKRKVTPAVTKLTFHEWFDSWVKEQGDKDAASMYRQTFAIVWTAARAGK